MLKQRTSITVVATLVVALIIGFISTSTLAFADEIKMEEDNSYTEVDAYDYINDNGELTDKINEALEKYDHIKIINDDKLEEPTFSNDNSQLSLEPQSAVGYIMHKALNVKKKSNSYGEDFLNISAEPDITIDLSQPKTKSYSMTIGTSYGCPQNTILNASWGTTSIKILTCLGSWKVPKTHNGKKVKKGYLHMRPEYKNKSCDIYFKILGYTDWKKIGTTTTKRAYAVDIHKSYVYK